MPVTGSKSTGPEKGPGGGGRTTFRPPWVKEGTTTSTPAATNKAPWVKKAETTVTKENGQPPVKEAKLQSREIKVPVMTTKLKPVQPPLKPKEERRDSMASGGEPVVETKKEFLIEKPKLRHVEAEPKEKSKTPNVLPEQPKLRPVLKKSPKVEEKEKPPPPFERKLSSAADRKIPAPPPPPPNGPNAPPPPPPPSLQPPPDFQKKPLSNKQKDVLDKLKQRARRRPDWSEMMKEVEDGKKLRHVECNDRSRPILTVKSMTKVGGQFVFETEKANVHNKLLQQIQSGIRLKPVKTNDRSKPFLEGLRKFRRQMTIEEQIQKSESRAALNEEPEESEDEMDDIDKLRDDLQSTKQMLALELRNKEAQERENKLLQAKIANLEAELEREKSKSDSNTSVSTSSSAADEVLVNSLKKDAEEARKTCKELEKKYQQSAEQLDSARSEIEEHKRMIANLEKKLAQGFNKSFSKSNSNRSQCGFCYSFEDSNDSDIYYEQEIYYEQGGTEVRRPSEAAQKESSPEPEIEESESESDEDEEKKAERLARRLGREVKMLSMKLQKLKDKQQAAQKERTNLKEAMKKNQVLLKEESKRYKKLQKEVDKMAKMLHEDEEDDDALEKAEEEEEEEEEEESESEEETETEESEEESGSETESESEDEDASDEDKKSNLEPRIKKHEGRLNALKKGNYLLQTNVDRLLDEVNKMREQSASLQRDLDSVLSELG